MDLFAAGEVGDGSRDLEDAVVGAGGEVHLFHRVLQITRAGRVERAVLTHEFGGHGGIGGDAFVFVETLRLHCACGRDPLADGSGLFAELGGGEFFEIHQWHFHMDVDAIEKRTGNFLPVLFNRS